MEMYYSVLARWIHVGTAIVLVGGMFFLRFILTPAAAHLSEVDHENLKAAVMKKWRMFVHIGISLFIVSGFYNFIFVQIPKHKGQGGGYHMVIGLKILIAFAIFFLAEALVGRSKSFEGMRKNAKFWQLIIVLLSALVVGISGYAKVAMPGNL